MVQFYKIAQEDDRGGDIHIDLALDYKTGTLSSAIREQLDDEELCEALAAILAPKGAILESAPINHGDILEEEKAGLETPKVVPFDDIFTRAPAPSQPKSPSSEEAKRRQRDVLDSGMLGV